MSFVQQLLKLLSVHWFAPFKRQYFFHSAFGASMTRFCTSGGHLSKISVLDTSALQLLRQIAVRQKPFIDQARVKGFICSNHGGERVCYPGETYETCPGARINIDGLLLTLTCWSLCFHLHRSSWSHVFLHNLREHLRLASGDIRGTSSCYEPELHDSVKFSSDLHRSLLPS